MPVYNNLSGNRQQTAIPNNYANAAWGNGFDAANSYAPQTTPSDMRIFVNGRAGAEAFQMPAGVHVIPLFDATGGRLFVKGYDNNGFLRIMEDYDLVPHVEPEPPQYATKDDIRKMIEEALANVSGPNMKNYVTRNEMNKELSRIASGDSRRGSRPDDTQ